MKTVQQARRANNYAARMFFLVFNCEIKIVLNLENQNRTWLRNRTRVKIVRGYKYIYICTVLNLYILPKDSFRSANPEIERRLVYRSELA
jgi:hypothetical protein